jgi:hypothetical protein
MRIGLYVSTPAGLVLTLVALSADSAQSANRLSQCVGSKAEVLACCERTKKPFWWWEISASCRRELSCYPVRLANGRIIEECRLRPRDTFFTPGFWNCHISP